MSRSTFRRAGALLAAGVLTATLGSSGSAAPAPAADRATPDLCRSHGPIQAVELASGFAAAGCSLVGRVVVAGSSAVVVPPAGYGVGGDGVGAAGSVEAPSLEVSNLGGVVRASLEGGLPSGGTARPGRRAAAACHDSTFRLESGGHPWGQTLRWRYHAASTPARFSKASALTQIKAGMANMRSGHNNCGLKPSLRTSSRYVGSATSGPNVRSGGGRVTCGGFNRTNTVGWGSLPAGLLGWTCYWWGGNQKMTGADMLISPSSQVVLTYPAGCSQKFDVQSLTTHEWGHAWGLGHVANPHLTMHHLLPPCAPTFRTLGLGDVRGLKKLYG